MAARLLQGLSVGGEFGTSATYLSEVATPGRRGFYSSFQYVSIVLGQLLALVVLIVLQQTLSEDQMYSWGWRIPFFIGAAASLVVLYLRRTMDESTSFEAEKEAEQKAAESGQKVRKGLSALLREYPVSCSSCSPWPSAAPCRFYTWTTYMQKYLVNTSGISKPTASLIIFAALFVFMCLQPIAGRAVRPDRAAPGHGCLRRRWRAADRAADDPRSATPRTRSRSSPCCWCPWCSSPATPRSRRS